MPEYERKYSFIDTKCYTWPSKWGTSSSWHTGGKPVHQCRQAPKQNINHHQGSKGVNWLGHLRPSIPLQVGEDCHSCCKGNQSKPFCDLNQGGTFHFYHQHPEQETKTGLFYSRFRVEGSYQTQTCNVNSWGMKPGTQQGTQCMPIVTILAPTHSLANAWQTPSKASQDTMCKAHLLTTLNPPPVPLNIALAALYQELTIEELEEALFMSPGNHLLLDETKCEEMLEEAPVVEDRWTQAANKNNGLIQRVAKYTSRNKTFNTAQAPTPPMTHQALKTDSRTTRSQTM